jgi:predicted DCC family thiol-disulfide oxidoreductase YuxK
MTDETRVLYNGQCPVCSSEIAHYSKTARANDLPIRFDDLHSDALGHYGVDADTAARRLHVLHQGQLFVGLDAFIVLWRQLPRFRLLAWLVALPGLKHIAAVTYDHILAPALYNRHRRRLRRKAPNDQQV